MVTRLTRAIELSAATKTPATKTRIRAIAKSEKSDINLRSDDYVQLPSPGVIESVGQT